MSSVASTTRRPNIYVESSTKLAKRVGGNQPHKCLIIGYKLSGGTATNSVISKVSSLNSANTLFGKGSMLQRMAKAYFSYAKGAPQLYALPLAEAGGGAKATAEISVTGTATEAGSLNIYIGDDFKSIPVNSGDTGATIATRIVTEFNKVVDKHCALEVDGVVTTQVNITANHKGSYGNDLQVYVNQVEANDSDPAGLTVAVTGFSSGTGEADLSTINDLLGNDYYNYIVTPDAVEAQLEALGTVLVNRSKAKYMQHSIAICGVNKSATDFTTFMSGINEKRISVRANAGQTMPNFTRAAYDMAFISYTKQRHPALGLSEELIPFDRPAPQASRYSDDDIESILADGGSVDKILDEQVYIDRYRATATTEDGAETEIYEDFSLLAGASYATWYFQQGLKKFQNGVTYDPNLQAPVQKDIIFVNENILRAEMIRLGRDLAQNGYLENFADFEESIEVTRASSDRFNIVANINYTNPVYIVALELRAVI